MFWELVPIVIKAYDSGSLQLLHGDMGSFEATEKHFQLSGNGVFDNKKENLLKFDIIESTKNQLYKRKKVFFYA